MASVNLDLILFMAIMFVTVPFYLAETTYIVGGTLGWVIPPGGANYYTNWASLHTFAVGDILVFNFTNELYDVAEVSATDYDPCTSSILKGPASITLTSVGIHYFIMEIFKKVELNIPLLSAIKQITRYAKFLKDFCVSKRKLKNNEILQVNENVSAVLQKGMPLKCKDPGAFTIPCKLGNINFTRVLLDNGASINVLPYSVFKILKVGDLKETGVAIQLADKSIVHPKGVLEDVLVQVKHLIFPADFYVLDMGDDDNLNSSSILLGRPFLKTSRTKFDCYDGSLTMEFDGDVIHFNIPEPIKPIGDVLSVNLVSTIASNAIDDCVFTTNNDLQVLVVDKNVAIGTPDSRLVKKEDKKEVKKSAKGGNVNVENKEEGAVLEVPMKVKEVVVDEKEKKKRKRRKWK